MNEKIKRILAGLLSLFMLGGFLYLLNFVKIDNMSLLTALSITLLTIVTSCLIMLVFFFILLSFIWLVKYSVGGKHTSGAFRIKDMIDGFFNLLFKFFG